MIFEYPESLPISQEKSHIIHTIQRNQVVILAGETGSGKTTQLPKMCLQAFPEIIGMIGCTQPRRIAATAVSSRVAEELKTTKDIVSYKIRFHDKSGPDTKIKFMTDGVLLAETRNDPQLKKYGVIIVDEAHERSLNIDFLLGYLKRLIKKRPDLKILITSATIDTQAFSKHFNNAPVISVSGRSYPVQVEYSPPEDEERGSKISTVEHCVSVLRTLVSKRPNGDILVFLATEKDIRECCKILESSLDNVMVLPLFGRLGSGDQRKIFQQSKRLKIIISTNVAETSLTVPGIRYVIDSGLARISNYNPRAKTTSLPIERISRASCDQREGRCGRVGPGICIRLYSEEDYLGREEFTVPEIKRSNLAEVILQMISLKLGDPTHFPFIDPPFKNNIKEGYRLLTELGAIDNRRNLTANGKIMADLPIDPCISRIIIEAGKNNCLKEILIISAALAIQDPRIRPADNEEQADNAHKEFAHPHSDFSTLLAIWEKFHEDSSDKLSWSRLKKYCKSNFFSFQRMREWFDLHDQLVRLVSRRKQFSFNTEPASYEQIHKSLLSGFLRNLAQKKESKMYVGTHNKEFMIFPGSGQFAKASNWIMCASFIDTNRLYAINVASISSEWIESVAQGLCKYSWSNPHWRKKSGTVAAEESVSLFGLSISSGRIVNFVKRSDKNMPEARNIFIQHALVQGEINGHYKFLIKNSERIIKWQESEVKLRSRNIVADDYSFFQFYDRTLPSFVCDQPSLNKFLKRNKQFPPLFMKDEDIIIRKPAENELVNFPATRQIGSFQIQLDYAFNPGSQEDGVTFRLPTGLATILARESFDWLVPGLFREKLTYLLKSLPKSVRKRLVPVNGSVNRILDDIDFGKGPLFPTLEQSIYKLFGFQINREDWAKDIPVHLTPRFVLIDEKNNEFLNGRDLGKLIENLAQSTKKRGNGKEQFQQNPDITFWEEKEFTTWEFDNLPKQVTLYNKRGEVIQILFPAFKKHPEKSVVTITFISDFRNAATMNQSGLLFLYRLQFTEPYRALKKLCNTSLSGPSLLQLLAIAGSKKELVEKFLSYVMHTLFPAPVTTITSRETFDQRVSDMQKQGFYKSAQHIVQQTLQLLRMRRESAELIEATFYKSKQKGHALPPVKEKFNRELDNIFPLTFLDCPQQFVPEKIERYLKYIKIRLERFYADPRKDQLKEQQLAPYLNQLAEVGSKIYKLTPEATEAVYIFQNMINDYRLLLFAPEIRGNDPTSAKKLEKQWKIIKSLC